MGPEDTEIDEEFGYRLGYHRATAVGVDGVRRGSITVTVSEVRLDGRVKTLVRHVLGSVDDYLNTVGFLDELIDTG